MRIVLASMFCLLITTMIHAAEPNPVILDTDIGDDIDDTWALGMLLGRPEIDLKLVVTASTDTPAKARLTARILEHMDRTDIPIGIGKKTSDRPIAQARWIEGYDFASYPGEVREDGVGALIDTIMAAPEPIMVIVIGPQTNIAEALQRDPSIAENATIVTMAGSIHTGYNGAPEPQPEYNVFRDIEAARAVFAAPWSITMAPLDICGTLRLTGDRYQRVAASDHRRAMTVIANYDIWTNRDRYGEHESSVLFDTVAVYLAYDDALCQMKTLNLSIDDKGATIIDEENGRPVRCALDWKDREAFEKLLLESLTTDP